MSSTQATAPTIEATTLARLALTVDQALDWQPPDSAAYRQLETLLASLRVDLAPFLATGGTLLNPRLIAPSTSRPCPLCSDSDAALMLVIDALAYSAADYTHGPATCCLSAGARIALFDAAIAPLQREVNCKSCRWRVPGNAGIPVTRRRNRRPTR